MLTIFFGVAKHRAIVSAVAHTAICTAVGTVYSILSVAQSSATAVVSADANASSAAATTAKATYDVSSVTISNADLIKVVLENVDSLLYGVDVGVHGAELV